MLQREAEEEGVVSKVLLVDDDNRLAHVVSAFLEGDGFEVEHLATGAEALERAQSGSWDVVILDIGLDDMDGIEVCERLRQLPEHRTVPIIVFSARSAEAEVERARSAGATRYISKPYTLDGLAEVVRSYTN